MNANDFDNTFWKPGMFASYQGKKYAIAQVDFTERLVGILGLVVNEPDEISFIRCENVELL